VRSLSPHPNSGLPEFGTILRKSGKPDCVGERVGVRGSSQALRLAEMSPHPTPFANARVSTSQPKSDLSDFGPPIVPKSGKPDFGCTRGEGARAQCARP